MLRGAPVGADFGGLRRAVGRADFETAPDLVQVLALSDLTMREFQKFNLFFAAAQVCPSVHLRKHALVKLTQVEHVLFVRCLSGKALVHQPVFQLHAQGGPHAHRWHQLHLDALPELGDHLRLQSLEFSLFLTAQIFKQFLPRRRQVCLSKHATRIEEALANFVHVAVGCSGMLTLTALAFSLLLVQEVLVALSELASSQLAYPL